MKKFRNKKLISLVAILLATACSFGLYTYNIKHQQTTLKRK